MLYILVRGDAAGSYYRDFRAEFCGIAFYSLDDLSDLIVVGFRCIGIQLFLVEAQMTACLGTFFADLSVETMGAIFVLLPLTRAGSSVGSPAPEMIRSAPAWTAAFT